MHHRLLVVPLLALAATAAAPAGAALADAPRTGHLTCDDGSAYDVEGQLNGAGWQVVDSSTRFVVTYLRADASGAEVVRHSPGKERLDELHCAYEVSDRDSGAYVEGFLTGPGQDTPQA